MTLRPEFEAKQIEIFGNMAQKGYVYKGLKPVYWCPDCNTALAEAEIEYEEDPCFSIYVKFAVKDAVLTIDGAKVEAMSQAIMLSGTGSILHLKDSVINGNSYAVNLSNGIINIENTVINDDSEYKGYALSVANGTAVINSGIFNYNGNMSSILLGFKRNYK